MKIGIPIYKYTKSVKWCSQLCCKEHPVYYRIKTVGLDFCAFRSLKLEVEESSAVPSVQHFIILNQGVWGSASLCGAQCISQGGAIPL